MKYNPIRDDYPTTPQNIIAYEELLNALPKDELLAWVKIRQGCTLEEVSKTYFPAYGLPRVSNATIRRILFRVHDKLKDVLE